MQLDPHRVHRVLTLRPGHDQRRVRQLGADRLDVIDQPAELHDEGELVGAELEDRAVGPDELMFVAPEGGPLRASTFRGRVFGPAVRRAGLAGLTFHGLRHTAAGLMIEAGAHMEAIKQRLGHSSIRVTSDVYGSLLPAVDESVTDALETAFALRCGVGVGLGVE